MSTSPSINVLIMSGSSRTGSLNLALAHAAGRLAAQAGAQITSVDLSALDLPIYDGDLEAAQGLPEGARELRRLFAGHDALLLSCPEYNALPTPLLINSFDWLSRAAAEAGLPGGTAATSGKVVGLLAASPGALGGVRGLPIVRQYLATNFGMLVVPEHFGLGHADAAFDEQGGLKAEAHQHALARVVNGVLKVATALKAGQG